MKALKILAIWFVYFYLKNNSQDVQNFATPYWRKLLYIHPIQKWLCPLGRIDRLKIKYYVGC